MAGKSSINGNWAPGSPATRYNASGKNREFYTFENAPGLGNYATGGTIIDGGDGYIYHIFTGAGTFDIPSNTPSTRLNSVDYLIVAGGGAGGTWPAPPGQRGGGGGGGVQFGSTPVSPGLYPVSVGGGGASPGNPGSGSSFGSITSTGGGFGRVGGGLGGPGGSGGGGGTTGTNYNGGTGNSPAKIPRQGYPGGSTSGGTLAGGGGGAGGIGGNAPGPGGGLGGPGRIVPEFPSTIVRQAIPAPVLPSWEPLVGPGGYAAGGKGSPNVTPRPSPDNSGYGAQIFDATNAGGSGIVCVRYKKTEPYSRATGGTIEPNTHSEHPGVWRHIFTSPGDFTVTDPTLRYVDYLAVGGGGGGAGGATSPGGAGGGGGAGGFVSSIHTSTTTPTSIPEAYLWNTGYSVQVGEQYPVGVGIYPIGIGTGGNGGVGTNGGNPGYDTTIGSPGAAQIIAVGGGGGGYDSNGSNGGSGGGGSKGFPSSSSRSGGTATPPPSIQGNTGGGTAFGSDQGGGGAGGGAGGVGGNIDTPGGGAGGSGWYSVLSPSAYGTPGPLTPNPERRYFAGGGGGGGGLSPGPTQKPGGIGGSGGGGAGANMPTIPPSINPATPGTTNTGGGGGGARAITPSTGGSGGPGIVIIQYPE